MTAAYYFGRMELRPATRELLFEGALCTIGARAFDLLSALVERRDRIVSKNELLNLVWHDTVVEEANLQVQVSTLRKLLGRKAIATIPGRGYRFTMALEAPGEPIPTPTKPASLPAPVASAATPNNLPWERTHFIGRGKALHECACLLDGSPLLTLAGIGGGGKTRLALKLAHSLLPAFPDGVWFVDLAPLQDAQRVPLALATALRMVEHGVAPLLDRLTTHLAMQRALIVLDNCEHVIDAVVELTEALLMACANVKILATSREILGVTGEQTFQVRSLSVPMGTDITEIGASEAVQLFVDRARLVNGRIGLDATNAPVVAEICRRLDGIPLAIELAAARMQMLSAEEIRGRLDDRFRLLTGRNRAMPRHQTLQTVIQWSYHHLSSEERRLFCLLSVFAGGWSLDAATCVAGEDLDELEVLGLLTRLADQSLVMAEPGNGGATRYAMLETVRQYAQQQLNDAGAGDDARSRHLAFYLALTEEAVPKLMGPDQGAWLSRLNLECENLLSALAWPDPMEGGGERGLRLVDSTNLYWRNSGRMEQGYRITMDVLARAAAQEQSLVRCRALHAAGHLGYLTGRYEEAQGYAEAAHSIARESGERECEVAALQLLGDISHAQGDRATARRHLTEALDLARALGVYQRLVFSLNALAELHRSEDDFDAARMLYEEGLALARKQGDPFNSAIALFNLAQVSIRGRSTDAVPEMLLDVLANAEATGSSAYLGGGALEGSAGLAAFLQDWERSARFYGATEVLVQQTGYQREPADALFLAPLISRARDAMGNEKFAAAEAAGRALSYEAVTAEARAWLAAVKREPIKRR